MKFFFISLLDVNSQPLPKPTMLAVREQWKKLLRQQRCTKNTVKQHKLQWYASDKFYTVQTVISEVDDTDTRNR